MKKLILALTVLAASAGTAHADYITDGKMAREAAQEAGANIESMIGPELGASALKLPVGIYCKVKINMSGGYISTVDIISGNQSLCNVVKNKLDNLGAVGGMSPVDYSYITRFETYQDQDNTTDQSQQEPEATDPNMATFDENKKKSNDFFKTYKGKTNNGRLVVNSFDTKAMQTQDTSKPVEYICDMVTAAPVDYDNFEVVNVQKTSIVLKDNIQSVSFKRFYAKSVSTVKFKDGKSNTDEGVLMAGDGNLQITFGHSALSAIYKVYGCVKK